jgi:2-dehydropantoate 2-reductase
MEEGAVHILVYGAGPLGSIFAANLQQGGHAVSLLARGQRLADLREHGIVLEDFLTKERTTTRVNVVERLLPDDAYDLILVIMRKNNALDILPTLAANAHTLTILFLMNNAAGPDRFVEALGAERVLTGFLSSAGYREGHVIYALSGTAAKPMPVLMGEVDGRITGRTRAIAEALERAPGYTVQIQTNMDAWSKTHVALLMPSLAPALYAAGTNNERLARTRDALVLAVRAIREGFRVLRALNIPVIPAKLRFMAMIPEPLLVMLLRMGMRKKTAKVALSGHANAARDEMKHLADEFLVLARQTPVPTPAIDRLYPYFDPGTPLMPDGRATIPLQWL